MFVCFFFLFHSFLPLYSWLGADRKYDNRWPNMHNLHSILAKITIKFYKKLNETIFFFFASAEEKKKDTEEINSICESCRLLSFFCFLFLVFFFRCSVQRFNFTISKEVYLFCRIFATFHLSWNVGHIRPIGQLITVNIVA